MSNIDETLAERGERYGEFTEHADITQSIKDAMGNSNNWYNLDNDQKECLEMVAHKIGRILNGDPDYIDSWTDIIGYTRLVEKRLIAEQESAKALMQGGEPNVQIPLFDTRTATADETAKIEELLKGFNPTVGTLSDAEQTANAAEQCNCMNCQTVRAFAELLEPKAKVVDMDKIRKAKADHFDAMLKEAADFDARLKEMEDKVHAALRVVNSGVRFG